MTVQLHNGDCLDVLAGLPEASIDACVCDPPYGLAFMGKEWDSFPLRDRGPRLTGSGNPTEARGFANGVKWDTSREGRQAFNDFLLPRFVAIRRVLKPGAYLLAFGGSRTYHRMACAVEDAGFVIRDCVLWLHGQGFPKSQACLKPAYEPIVLAWNPAEVVTPLRIDESRIAVEPGDYDHPGNETLSRAAKNSYNAALAGSLKVTQAPPDPLGRWPANVAHDGSPEVLEAFAAAGERGGGGGKRGASTRIYGNGKGFTEATGESTAVEREAGSAARFYYCSKATKRDRDRGNTHSTVKPTALMRWLVGLVSKPDDVILDPFLGSGTTGVACHQLHRSFVGIELDPTYFKIAERRLNRQAARYALFDRPTG